MRRLGLFVLVLMIAGSFPVQCFGWQTTAAGRMDCCRKAGHDCPDQRAADACCRNGEQAHERSVPVAGFVSSSPVAHVETFVVARAAVAFADSAVRWFRLAIEARPSRPPYALTSVLLI